MMINMWKVSFIIIVLVTFATCENATSAKKRVCVIGAGASGLTSSKLLSAYPEEFETIVFEKQSDVGGLWIYTDSTTVDEHGLPVHSSLYKYLRTNFPRELETFPDYPEFRGDESKGSFVEHTQMLQYLKNYTEYYNLRKYIKLSTNVEKVSPLPEMRWLVEARDLNTNRTSETECDAVIVNNGNNVKGHIPKIPGIDSFPGRVLHSHTYRYPEEFANQTVLILGASFSGNDISIDISRFAKKVYLSHRGIKLPTELPANVEPVLGVKGAEGSELILSLGFRVKVDALVFCTGYEYDYPFLDESSGIVVEDGKHVVSVYKHMINIERPTMAILNLPTPGLPFLLPHAQAAYFIAVLRGKIVLPSRSEMLKDAALPPFIPKKKAHYMAISIYPYYNELAVAAGAEPLSKFYLNSALAVLPHLIIEPLHFREKKLHVDKNGKIKFY